MLKLNGVGPLGLALFLSSCVAGSVIDPPTHTSALASAAPAGVRCPAATLSNTDAVLQERFQLAMAEACAVLMSPEFRRTVEGLNLARKCPAFLGKHRLIPGLEIYRRLAGGMPESFTITAERLSGSTVAVTTAANRTMSIEPRKLRDWATGTAADRAATVNTLVHEMTHLVLDEGGGSYFQDGWQWTPWCDSNRLVSYRLGNEAGAQWRRSHTG